MTRIIVLFLGLLMVSFSVHATHNRAGEITYKHLGGNNYEVTVTTYTKNSSPADRCEVEVFWGDNTSEFLPRINGNTIGSCSPARMGEIIPNANDVKKNIYRGTHSYPSSGTFVISMQDPNRNQGIANIPNSVNVVFYLQTTIVLNPILGPNSSPELLNPPIDDGCTGKLFVHNPAAFDADGDSLAYRLVDVRGVNGNPFASTYNPGFVQDPVTIDSITGDLIWDVPQVQGQFNFAIEIIEYRKSSSGVWALMSKVTRDLQVTIMGNCQNDPPEIPPIGPFCVVAGDTLAFDVTAIDPNNDPVSLTAEGGPFEVDTPAFISGNTTGTGTVTRLFNWRTACNHIRQQNYFVYFRAVDNPPPFRKPALSAYQTVQIQVISPPPLNPDAFGTALGVELMWQPAACNGAVRYDVYRREGPSGWDPGKCETGVPGGVFEKIAEVNGINNTFYNDDQPEKVGIVYCYRIVAVYADGAESIASEEVCAELPKTLPVLTNADVETSDTVEGVINIAWTRPYEIDSVLFPPPYRYELYRATGINSDDYTLLEVKDDLLDTTYIDTELNTIDSIYRYRVDLLLMPSESKLGESVPATQPFLRTRGSNGEIRLTYQFSGPWRNDTLIVFREIPQLSGTFDSIGYTTEGFYVDTGLVNGEEYCYYLLTIGNFDATGLPENLHNRSQIACGIALDTTRPCAPIVSNEFSCPKNPTDKLELVLDFAFDDNPDCPDHDFVSFNIYYKEKIDHNYPDAPKYRNITEMQAYDFEEPFSGCYKVTVIKVNPIDPDEIRRESDFSEEFCIPACPEIEFPNVFSPNGDGDNDFYFPVQSTLRDIRNIDIQIFNRWGNLMYENETTDQFINIGWDGTDMRNGRPASEGTYYYVARVVYRGLTPQDEMQFSGHISLFR